MRPLRIKLCGVRSVHDALLCANAGADELGVVFAEKSKRRISIDEASAIREAIPAALPLIGVFQDASNSALLDVTRGVKLSAVQLHGALPAELFSEAFREQLRVPVIVALQITSAESLSRLDLLTHCSRVLLDGPRGGSGAAFPWALVREARSRFAGELFLAGGLTPENVAEAIALGKPDGVDVSSGIEGADGYKDAQRVTQFVQAARGAT